MLGGREIMALFIGWVVQLSLIGGILFAAYKLNELYKQMEELREDVRVVRDRVEGVHPAE